MFAAAADATTELRTKALLLQWSPLPFKNCFYFAMYLHDSLLLKKLFFFYYEITQLSLMSIFVVVFANVFVGDRAGQMSPTHSLYLATNNECCCRCSGKRKIIILYFSFISFQFNSIFFAFSMFCCPSNFCVVVVVVVFKHISLCVCVCATVLPF